MAITIRIFKNADDAGIYVASIAEMVIRQQQHPVLGLATGSTPIPFYKALVNLYDCGLDLSHVTTVNLDEYVGLSGDHPQSYRYFMQEQLFSKTNLHQQNTHVPNGVAEDLDQECHRYDQILQKHTIDFQILGIGLNGHIGFNEPSDTLLAKTHVVHLKEATVKSNARFFESIDQVPNQAITMGVQAILQAKKIVLMAFGEEKASIIEQVILGDVSTNIPASILQLHQDIHFVLDIASASKLLANEKAKKTLGLKVR